MHRAPPVRIDPDWVGPGGFARFLDHFGERPEGTSLGRIGDEGGYVPGNVGWMTHEEQLATRRAKCKRQAKLRSHRADTHEYDFDKDHGDCRQCRRQTPGDAFSLGEPRLSPARRGSADAAVSAAGVGVSPSAAPSPLPP
jgi:hypothetical protein